MKTEFTKAYILSHRGCFERSEIMELVDGIETASIYDILSAKIPFKDKAHFIITKGELTDLEKQTLNINLALVVLPIFEEFYWNSEYALWQRIYPRTVIEAAQMCLENKISLEELKNRKYDIRSIEIKNIDDIPKKVLSSACSACQCVIDPKNYSGDGVYDAYDAAESYSEKYVEKVENKFFQIINELFIKHDD